MNQQNSNYETHLVELWLNNDEDLYFAVRTMARSFYDSCSSSQYLSRDEEATSQLAEWLATLVEAQCEIESPTLASDLLSNAIRSVNFHEIARDIIVDISEEFAHTE